MAAPQPSVMSNVPGHVASDNISSPAEDVETFLRMISHEDRGLQLTKEELDAEEGASAEALEIFLETPGLYTTNTFNIFMNTLRNGHKPEEYDMVREEYEGSFDPCFKGFTVGLYFLDEELLVRGNGLRANFQRPGTIKEKIDVAISTILWLDHLDRSAGKDGWKTTFLSFDQGQHDQYFKLLFDTRLLFILRDGAQPAEMRNIQVDKAIVDKDIVDNLGKMWDWFDTHPERPVRLAFAMARHGMMWDLFAEGRIGRLHRIVDRLRALHQTVF